MGMRRISCMQKSYCRISVLRSDITCTSVTHACTMSVVTVSVPILARHESPIRLRLTMIERHVAVA